MADAPHPNPMSAAASATSGWIQGALAGIGVGAALLAAISGVAEIGLQLITTGSVTWGLSGVGGAVLDGIALGAAGGGAIGGISGAVSGFLNTRSAQDDGLERAQEKQTAYAQGLVQGLTAARVDEIQEETQKWRTMHPSKACGGQYCDLATSQAQQKMLLEMEPQGRA